MKESPPLQGPSTGGGVEASEWSLRWLWETMGGLDPALIGHRWEDIGLGHRCDAVTALWFVEGEALELWHATERADNPDDLYYAYYEANLERWRGDGMMEHLAGIASIIAAITTPSC